MGDLEHTAAAVEAFKAAGGSALFASVQNAMTQRTLSQREWCAIASLFEDYTDALGAPPVSSYSLLCRWKAILRRVFGTEELAIDTKKLYADSAALSERYSAERCIPEPFCELKEAAYFVVKYECAIAPLRKEMGKQLLETVRSLLPSVNLRLLLGAHGYDELPDLLKYDFPRGMAVLQELEVWAANGPYFLSHKRNLTLQQLTAKISDTQDIKKMHAVFLYAQNYARRF